MHFSGSLSVHRQGIEDVRPSGHLVISLASFPAACFSQTFHVISAGTSRERKGQVDHLLLPEGRSRNTSSGLLSLLSEQLGDAGPGVPFAARWKNERSDC